MYAAYQVCLNGGFCSSVNGEPACICPSYPTFTLSGVYCEIRKDVITTTPIKTTASMSKLTTTDNTLLVVEIVMPIIAFIIILILTMLIVFYCYKRYFQIFIFFKTYYDLFLNFIFYRSIYSYKKQTDDLGKASNRFKIPRILNFLRPNAKHSKSTNLENTDFDLDHSTGHADESDQKQPDLIDFSYEERSSKQEYRSAYPLENSNVPVNEYLHSLECKSPIPKIFFKNLIIYKLYLLQ